MIVMIPCVGCELLRRAPVGLTHTDADLPEVALRNGYTVLGPNRFACSPACVRLSTWNEAIEAAAQVAIAYDGAHANGAVAHNVADAIKGRIRELVRTRHEWETAAP